MTVEIPVSELSLKHLVGLELSYRFEDVDLPVRDFRKAFDDQRLDPLKQDSSVPKGLQVTPPTDNRSVWDKRFRRDA